MQRHGAGLAAWSIRHPIGTTLIALAVVVLGSLALRGLGIDLLPHIIYPEIRVRVLDPGVPASVMEDRITRQLEEQLAITEGAIAVQSQTSEGRSAVDLSFPYGTDMDAALRNASIRLDRARRFLPTDIEPPIIYKLDPSQRPVMELVVSSALRPPEALREWVDYRFGKWFLNLPGVAATEVGGAPLRELHVQPDPGALLANGLTLDDLARRLREANADHTGGRLETPSREIGVQLRGRFTDPAQIAGLPLQTAQGPLPLSSVARVLSATEDDRLRIRLDGHRGVKLSIQKQPEANTVRVADAVRQRLNWLRQQGLVPPDIEISIVGDQSRHVRLSLRNAALAAASGALLAMLVVWLFLGDLRRTLIIGSVIPVAILVTFVIMALSGLTLNIMTLGGLALGIGLLVDNTIVMMENISRHQAEGDGSTPVERALEAAAEVLSPIVAATSTNLAAILPFLFIGGLIGLLFRELVVTLAAALIASLLVAITLVPAWASRGGLANGRGPAQALLEPLIRGHHRLLDSALRHPAAVLLLAVALLAAAVTGLNQQRRSFLPATDEGVVWINLTTDTGTPLDTTDEAVRRIEALLAQDPRVDRVFSSVGGFVFGRSEYLSGNRASINVHLRPQTDGGYHSREWARATRKRIEELGLAGYRIRVRPARLRGLRTSRGDDDLSLRIQGPDLATLQRLGDEVITRLDGLPGLRNLKQSYEEQRLEITLQPDRARLAALGLDEARLGEALRIALDGLIVGDLLEDDRPLPIRLRLPAGRLTSPEQLRQLVVARSTEGEPVLLGSLAEIRLTRQPALIVRDQQQRIVEVSGSISPDTDPDALRQAIEQRLADLKLPPGYLRYDGGSFEQLHRGQRTGLWLSLLALFLVFVVMAVQYESLRSPLVILFSAPFSLIGVALALVVTDTPLSMPVWLGIIMLAGIVVNNAIVLVEQVDRLRERLPARTALIEASRQRLRPILMTTLTTVLGLTPLALGLGEGSELLQPLALTITWGLAFSLPVSLLLVPLMHGLLHPDRAQTTA